MELIRDDEGPRGVNDMNVVNPVIHKACGATIGYVPPHVVNGMRMHARDFTRLDATHPEMGTRFNEHCWKCDVQIRDPRKVSII